MSIEKLAAYPHLSRIVGRQIEKWPEHIGYISARFDADDDEFLKRSEDVACLVSSIIADDIDTYCDDYRSMCNNFYDEQWFFIRNKRYRYSTFAEAYEHIYGNDEYMRRYIHGILMSQLLWKNHAMAMDHYRRHFLTSAPDGYEHLEVGPGHGLFLYFAARDPRAGSTTAWELSNASIAATRHCLELFGVDDRVSLVQCDVMQAAHRPEDFDTILISEVLEHLERPDVAMETLRRSLRPEGRLLLNVPINSPAPDHIYLWSSREEVNAFIADCGFSVVGAEYYPVTGFSLESALKNRYSVSCVVTCKRAR